MSILSYKAPPPGELVELKLDWFATGKGEQTYHIRGRVECTIPGGGLPLPDTDLERYYPHSVKEKGIEWTREHLGVRQNPRLVVEIFSRLSHLGKPCGEQASEPGTFLVMPSIGQWSTHAPQRLQIYRLQAPKAPACIFDSRGHNPWA